MTAALEGGEWSAARPSRSLPTGKTRYPFHRRLGGSQGRSGRADNLVPNGIRFPDRPARNESIIIIIIIIIILSCVACLALPYFPYYVTSWTVFGSVTYSMVQSPS